FLDAIARYEACRGDAERRRTLMPAIREIIERHEGGTRFGVGMDERDGLLTQGAPGYQLTWMDAKVDDWVVTPRRGKAVEINALWYNALCLMASWAHEHDPSAAAGLADRAARVRKSFNDRFWFTDGPYLFDV